jgi:hypothetical protein
MDERHLYIEPGDDGDADFPWPCIRDQEGASRIYFDGSKLSPEAVQEVADAASERHPRPARDDSDDYHWRHTDAYDSVWSDIEDAILEADAYRGEG